MVLTEHSFSLWIDFLERDFVENSLAKLVEDGFINGATSNPAIFKQAITTSSAYSVQKTLLQNKSAKEIYEALAVDDIKMTAQKLRHLYDNGDDGFVSLEIDPFLAKDVEASIKEGERLWNSVNEPNLMIKVPASDEGYEVMKALLSKEINVNATLIFSPKQALKVCKAIKESNSKKAHAVISVFVSRFDRKTDEILKPFGLDGKLGIMNAAKIYSLVEEQKLPRTRTLFASTGVKGDKLPKYYYITQLIAPNSINTAPLETIEAFRGQEDRSVKLPISNEIINEFFEKIEKNGISMEKLYDELLSEGLQQFEAAFSDILESLK